MTYLDEYRAMSVEELCDTAITLFKRAQDEHAQGDARMISLRNILPFVVERLRDLERKGLSPEQRDLMNQADRYLRHGQAGESFKLRMEVDGMSRPK
jgi:hypothetical protein